MTRAERMAERKAREARIAVRVFAKLAAKRQVQAQIRAQGLRLTAVNKSEPPGSASGSFATLAAILGCGASPVF
jgi:hypothetical protein